MDLAAVFAISLLGGYYFAVLWRLTGFSTRRIDGHHLYFRAAVLGAIFFLVALLLRIYVLSALPHYTGLETRLVDYVKPALKDEPGLAASEQARRAEWLITAVYSLLIGPLCGVVFNIFTPRRWAQARSLRGLDRLLLHGQQRDMPVQLTLTTGKVYIGLPAAITDPSRESDMVTLVPMYSGYRDAQNHMVLTVDYRALYLALKEGRAKDLKLPPDYLSQFELAIRADTIVSATLFSPAIYATFNPDWQKKILPENQKPSPQEFIVELKRRPQTAPAAADPVAIAAKKP